MPAHTISRLPITFTPPTNDAPKASPRYADTTPRGAHVPPSMPALRAKARLNKGKREEADDMKQATAQVFGIHADKLNWVGCGQVSSCLQWLTCIARSHTMPHANNSSSAPHYSEPQCTRIIGRAQPVSGQNLLKSTNRNPLAHAPQARTPTRLHVTHHTHDTRKQSRSMKSERD